MRTDPLVLGAPLPRLAALLIEIHVLPVVFERPYIFLLHFNTLADRLQSQPCGTSGWGGEDNGTIPLARC